MSDIPHLWQYKVQVQGVCRPAAFNLAIQCCNRNRMCSSYTQKDWHDQLGWSYTQGNRTKNDARPPLAVMTYVLDKACLSCQGQH